MRTKRQSTRPRRGPSKPLVGSSISRLLGQKCPTEPAPSLDIPRTEIGILDTTRWKLDFGPLVRDRYARGATNFDFARLLKSCDWHEVAVTGRSQAREQRRLVRLRDGARISLYENSISLEVAAPRVLGFNNSQQDMLGERDSLRILRELPQLFEMTTFHARQKHGREWFAARLDLALNFEADIATLVEAYRTAKHPGIRSKADAYGSTGLGLYGSTMDFILYSPEKKPRRSKLTRKLGGKLLDPARGTARLEVRFKQPESVTRALQEMLDKADRIPLGSPMIPCLTIDRDGSKDVVPIPISNHELHRQLRREVHRLSGERQLSRPVATGNVIRNLGLLHLARHPEDMLEVERAYDRKTVARVRKEIAALQLKTLETSIFRLGWPRPQLRPGVRPTDTVSVGTARQRRSRSTHPERKSK